MIFEQTIPRHLIILTILLVLAGAIASVCVDSQAALITLAASLWLLSSWPRYLGRWRLEDHEIWVSEQGRGACFRQEPRIDYRRLAFYRGGPACDIFFISDYRRRQAIVVGGWPPAFYSSLISLATEERLKLSPAAHRRLQRLTRTRRATEPVV